MYYLVLPCTTWYYHVLPQDYLVLPGTTSSFVHRTTWVIRPSNETLSADQTPHKRKRPLLSKVDLVNRAGGQSTPNRIFFTNGKLMVDRLTSCSHEQSGGAGRRGEVGRCIVALTINGASSISLTIKMINGIAFRNVFLSGNTILIIQPMCCQPMRNNTVFLSGSDEGGLNCSNTQYLKAWDHNIFVNVRLGWIRLGEILFDYVWWGREARLDT